MEGGGVMDATESMLKSDDVRESGFPVYCFNRDDKRRELLKLLRYDHTGIITDGVVGQTMHGLALAWNYQPHAWGVRCGDRRTPLDIFGNDHLLVDALKRRRALGPCESASDLRKALRTYSGTQSVSNFRPTAAAALFDRYLPQSGGTVWDMSAGFGGRMLGALACGKVAKYVGTDPATLTMDGLREMSVELLPMMGRLGYQSPEVQLHKIGSEDFHPAPESLSMCCSSPPYGSHEQYSDEPTQSYIKFPTNEAWLNGYMRMTLENCRVGLKRDGFLVVNIAGVKSYPTLHDDFVALAEANGWQLVETLKLALTKMVGTGKQEATHKFEPVFVFTKKP
jgi:hypothetical protein